MDGLALGQQKHGLHWTVSSTMKAAGGQAQKQVEAVPHRSIKLEGQVLAGISAINCILEGLTIICSNLVDVVLDVRDHI